MAESDRSLGANWPGWLKTLAAPLFVVSLLAHGLLLVIPVPSSSAPELEAEGSAEEEFVDLLSISSLPTSEPEPALPSTPPPEAAPPPAPAAAAASAPTQPVVPEVYPDGPPPEAAPPPTEDAFTAAPEPEPVAFVQEAEVVEIFTRLTRGSGDSDFDSTETSFPAIAYLIPGGIKEWSAEEQACFFIQIDDTDFRLLPKAASLRYLTRGVEAIENQDIPRTFPAPEFALSSVADGYCNRPLYQVLRNGQPYVFVSVAGVGSGAVGRQASGLVIIWSSDPRSS